MSVSRIFHLCGRVPSVELHDIPSKVLQGCHERQHVIPVARRAVGFLH